MATGAAILPSTTNGAPSDFKPWGPLGNFLGALWPGLYIGAGGIALDHYYGFNSRLDRGINCVAYARDLKNFMIENGDLPSGMKVHVEITPVWPYNKFHERLTIEYKGETWEYDPYWRVGPLFKMGAPGTTYDTLSDY